MSLRLVMIAPLRFPIRHPFAGGLESTVWNELRLLRRRGHRVSLIATAGSDFLDDGPDEFVLPAVDWAGDPRATDDTYPDGYLERALPALARALDVVGELAASPEGVDVVVNHSLHGLPLERAGSLGAPMISTLHTPVVDDLANAHARGLGRRSRFLSVSAHTRRTWALAGVDSDVLRNGVDADQWRPGAGGDGLVWCGRLVPEKAPHLAIDAAATLGRPLTIAGRIGDRAYFEAEVESRLGEDVRYVGPLATPDLARFVGGSACALVTPLWDEPFGLVTPEALLCGTPVAAFDVGGITELARSSRGLDTVPVGDASALAAAADTLITRSADPGYRPSVAHDARERFSLDSRISALEKVLREVAEDRDEVA